MHAYRRTRCIAFLLLALFSFGAYRAGAGQEHSSDLQLIVNDVHLPLFFEDQTLTDSEKDVIVADCQFLLDQLSPEGRRPLRSKVIQQEEGAVRITSALLYSARAYKRPRATRNQLGIIGESDDGHEYIVIQETLSDAYIVALKLALGHKEACRSLERFIALLNGLDTRQLPSMGDLYFLYGEAKKYSEETAGKSKQEFVDDCKKYRYSRGSVLELRLFESNLMTNIHAMTRDSGKHKSGIPLIYHEDHWKIFITLTE